MLCVTVVFDDGWIWTTVCHKQVKGSLVQSYCTELLCY